MKQVQQFRSWSRPKRAPAREPAEPGLFDAGPDRPLARGTDPRSSREAADEVVRSGRFGRQMAAVLEAARRYPGKTSLELSVASGIDRYVCGRRLSDLEKRGAVRKGEIRRCEVGDGNAVTWWADR